MAKNSLYIIVAIVVIIIVVGGVLAYVFTRPSGGGGGGGNTMDIYAAEYKFGTSAGNLNNPTLTFTAGQTYTVTLHNVGTTGHAWAIVMTKADGATDLAFSGAQVGSASNPVQPGNTGQAGQLVVLGFLQEISQFQFQGEPCRQAIAYDFPQVMVVCSGTLVFRLAGAVVIGI